MSLPGATMSQEEMIKMVQAYNEEHGDIDAAIANAITNQATNAPVGVANAAAKPAKPDAPTEAIGDTRETEDKELFEEAIAMQTKYGSEHPHKLVCSATTRIASNAVRKEVRDQIDDLLCEKLRAPGLNISNQQLDCVAMARYNWKRGLSMLIGDGTGVGKGRELVGCMLNQYELSGTRRFVYVSVSPALAPVLRADMKALGMRQQPLGFPQKATDLITNPEATLFITYSKLNRGGDRINQIVQWAGQHDIMIVLDECHKAAGGEQALKSKTCQAVLELQRLLPKAYFLFASATSANSIAHYRCMGERLGLFGPGRDFEDFKEFSGHFRSRTFATMEVVSSNMIANGTYITRVMGFEGAEFDTKIAPLSADARELHKVVTGWWWRLLKFCEQHDMTYVRGAMLRFAKAFLLVHRMDAVVEATKEHVEAGGSVVISMMSTGEAGASRTEDGDLAEEGYKAMKDIMKMCITSLIKQPIKKELYGPELEALSAELETIKFPGSPLDAVLKKLADAGLEADELSGRKERVVYRSATDSWVKQKRGEDANDSVKDRFQDGSLPVVVITAAASTGISLHNITSGPDRRRLQIMFELQWSATATLQQLGRTHRADQHCPPKYLLVTSDHTAEKRFAAIVASRVKALGATTAADRRGGHTVVSFSDEELVGQIGYGAIELMKGELLKSSMAVHEWPQWLPPLVEGFEPTDANPLPSPKEYARFRDEVMKALEGMAYDAAQVQDKMTPRKLLNALLMVPTDLSNRIFAMFSACIVQFKAIKQQNGTGTGDKKVMDLTLVADQDLKPGQTKLVAEEDRILTLERDIGIPWSTIAADMIEELSCDEADKRSGFYTSYNTITKQHMVTAVFVEDKWCAILVRPNGREVQVTLNGLRNDGYRRRGIKLSDDGAKLVASNPDSDTLDMVKSLWREEFKAKLHSNSGGRRIKQYAVKLPVSSKRLPHFATNAQIARISEVGKEEDAYVGVIVQKEEARRLNAELIKRREKLAEEEAKNPRPPPAPVPPPPQPTKSTGKAKATPKKVVPPRKVIPQEPDTDDEDSSGIEEEAMDDGNDTEVGEEEEELEEGEIDESDNGGGSSSASKKRRIDDSDTAAPPTPLPSEPPSPPASPLRPGSTLPIPTKGASSSVVDKVFEDHKASSKQKKRPPSPSDETSSLSETDLPPPKKQKQAPNTLMQDVKLLRVSLGIKDKYNVKEAVLKACEMLGVEQSGILPSMARKCAEMLS